MYREAGGTDRALSELSPAGSNSLEQQIPVDHRQVWAQKRGQKRSLNLGISVVSKADSDGPVTGATSVGL